MAITDLTGTKWRLNDYIPMDALSNFGGHETFRGTKYTVSFTSDYVSEHGQNYDELYGEANSGGTPTRYALRYKVGDVAVPGPYIVGEGYPSGKWHNEGAKTIEITGGEDATNTNLIAWLEANATQVVDPPQDWLYKFLNDSGLTRVFQKLKTVLDKKAALDVSTISTAGGGTEVHATVSEGDDEVSVNYYKQGTELPDYVNLNVSGDGFRLPTAGYVDKLAVPFIANYGQTTYADVTAAIDADRAIVVNFSNNKNLICVTYATYTAGQNVTMSGIYKYGSDVSLAEITLTPEGAWSIAHTAMQDKLVSGTSIKTLNNQSLLGSGNIDIPGGGTVDTAMSDTSENAVQNKVIKSYIDGATGDLSTLTTDDKTNLVSAINEVYEKSGEPFRVKNWANSSLNVSIPYCTEEVANTSIAKMTYSIDAEEGASYQIVGMIAYEVFDSSNQRINCWPVCQFTGNGQKELSVRWACMGSSRKTATKINAWVLLKHR